MTARNGHIGYPEDDNGIFTIAFSDLRSDMFLFFPPLTSMKEGRYERQYGPMRANESDCRRTTEAVVPIKPSSGKDVGRTGWDDVTPANPGSEYTYMLGRYGGLYILP